MVLLLARTMFLAGMAFAWLLQGGPPAPGAPYEAYAARFEQEFQLSPKRARLFRDLLRIHDQKRQAIRDRYQPDLDPAVGRELDAEAERFRTLIRDTVLPPEQRERYDAMLPEFQPNPIPR
ncbi:MAG: hypothetical protein R3E96_01375 [Planctomycetota bacterium]